MNELDMIDRVGSLLKLHRRTVRRFFDVLGLTNCSVDEAVRAIRSARRDGFTLTDRGPKHRRRK